MLNQVFISYRRENDDHVARVYRLAKMLRAQGLTVAFDEFYQEHNPGGPDEGGWPPWCIRNAKDSACVLMVGSIGWYSAFSTPGAAASGEGLGAAAEAHVIRQQLYDAGWVTNRHRVVLLDAADHAGLPVEIKGWRRFSPLGSEEEAKDLCRWAAGLTQITHLAVSEDWPETAPNLSWPIANHHEARMALSGLLTRGSSRRFLPVQGASESGKSHITRELYANALRMPWLACGRFDFKGTTDIDREIGAFVQELGVPMPPASPRLHTRLSQVVNALKERARPALLIFDTYEMAGEAEEWVERQLLTGLVRENRLRVVIAGQKVPASSSAVWRDIAHAPIQLNQPPARDWYEFGKAHLPDLTLEFVEQACSYAGKSSVLAQLLGPRRAL